MQAIKRYVCSGLVVFNRHLEILADVNAKWHVAITEAAAERVLRLKVLQNRSQQVSRAATNIAAT
jgi:hypothetical protein